MKPKAVIHYNKGKAVNSNSLRKTVKWFKKVTFELFLTTFVINFYILCKIVTEKNMSVLDFTKQRKYLVKTMKISQHTDKYSHRFKK